MKNLAAASIVLLVLALGYGAIFLSARADNLQQQISDTQEKLDAVNVGSSNAIESPVALFETTLANSITSSASTMTLSSALTKDGTTLASSTYSFIIDEGTAAEEFVSADCTGTACTNMQRGISVVTGTTTVATLQKAHRRGASVKITDGPILIYLSRILNGIGTFPNTLRLASGMTLGSIASYNSALSFTPASNQLASVLYAEQYANNVISSGAPTSSATVGGKVLLATQLQMASSTDLGVLAPLVLQAKYATSSPTISCGLCTVITNNAGKIAQGFFDLTNTYVWTGLHTFAAGILATGASTMATTTFTGPSINPAPVSQFTAGETITAGTPVTVSASSTAVYKASSAQASSTQYIGIAKTAATVGQTINVQTGGIYTGLSGLTVGTDYYSNDSAVISSTRGTVEIYVGKAITTTTLQITTDKPGQYNGSANISGSSSAIVPVYTHFILVTPMTVSQSTFFGGGGTGYLTRDANSATAGASVCCSLTSGSWSVTWAAPTDYRYPSVVTSSLSASAASGGGSAYFYR